MLGWLRNWFRPRPEPRDPFREFREQQARDAYRRIDGAETHRLNRDYWAGASDISINLLLMEKLPVLRMRARYEAMNNPVVKGVIGTYVKDLVGPIGPKLDVLTGDKTFNTRAEAIWNDWFARPDINGQLSGADVLRLAARGVITHGSYLWQIVTDRRASVGGLRTRLRVIDPRRLQNPVSSNVDGDVVLGIKINASGEPLGYYLGEARFGGQFKIANPTYVPADQMIHGFERLEPEQLTGFPLLTPVLEVIADDRQNDRYVMEASKAAAALSVYLFTEQPGDASTAEYAEEVDIEPGVATTLPPGWQAQQVTPSQPSAQYPDFKKQQHMKIGRPLLMPGVLVSYDYADLPFSAARLVMNDYHGGHKVNRAHFEQCGLTRLFTIIMAEAALSGMIDMPTGAIPLSWTWPTPASFDPLNDAKAATERMASLQSSLEEEAAAQGKELDELVESHRRSKDAVESIGMEYPIRRADAQPEPEPDANGEGREVAPRSANRNGTNGNGAGLLSRVLR